LLGSRAADELDRRNFGRVRHDGRYATDQSKRFRAAGWRLQPWSGDRRRAAVHQWADAGGRERRLSQEPVEQLRQIWANLKAVFEAAGVGISDLVHVRTYLADRSHRGVNTEVRREVLGSHEPALTVVICELFEPGWVAEIEAVARLRREGRA
jgi:2-iminobutanoate/2-iminopropanoate deaminase